MLDFAKFKLQLEAQKEELEKGSAHLKSTDPYLDNQLGMGNTLDDDITEIEGHDRIVATRMQMKQALVAINAALQKLDDGTFGKCEKCGQEIESERLEVMPTATAHLTCPKPNS